MCDDVMSAADFARVKAERAEAARVILAEAALNQEGDGLANLTDTP